MGVSLIFGPWFACSILIKAFWICFFHKQSLATAETMQVEITGEDVSGLTKQNFSLELIGMYIGVAPTYIPEGKRNPQCHKSKSFSA